MGLEEITLRESTQDGLSTKGETLTWAEVDNNFIQLYLALANPELSEVEVDIDDPAVWGYDGLGVPILTLPDEALNARAIKLVANGSPQSTTVAIQKIVGINTAMKSVEIRAQEGLAATFLIGALGAVQDDFIIDNAGNIVVDGDKGSFIEIRKRSDEAFIRIINSRIYV